MMEGNLFWMDSKMSVSGIHNVQTAFYTKDDGVEWKVK